MHVGIVKVNRTFVCFKVSINIIHKAEIWIFDSKYILEFQAPIGNKLGLVADKEDSIDIPVGLK